MKHTVTFNESGDLTGIRFEEIEFLADLDKASQILQDISYERAKTGYYQFPTKTEL